MNIILKSFFLNLEVSPCPLLRSLFASLSTQGIHHWLCRGPGLCSICCSLCCSDPRLGNVLWSLSDLEISYCAEGQNAFSLPLWLWAQMKFKNYLCSAFLNRGTGIQPPQALAQCVCHLESHVRFFISFILLPGIKYLIIYKDPFQISTWMRRHQSNYGHLLAIIWTWSAC